MGLLSSMMGSAAGADIEKVTKQVEPFLLDDEVTIITQSFDGQDNAIKVDVAYNFGKISVEMKNVDSIENRKIAKNSKTAVKKCKF